MDTSLLAGQRQAVAMSGDSLRRLASPLYLTLSDTAGHLVSSSRG